MFHCGAQFNWIQTRRRVFLALHRVRRCLKKSILFFLPSHLSSFMRRSRSLHQSSQRHIRQMNSTSYNFIYFSSCIIFRLDVHLVATHHYPKDSFHCEHCSKSYCYRPSLLRHRAVVHGEYRKYPCENCSKVSPKSLIYIFTLIRSIEPKRRALVFRFDILTLIVTRRFNCSPAVAVNNCKLTKKDWIYCYYFIASLTTRCA